MENRLKGIGINFFVIVQYEMPQSTAAHVVLQGTEPKTAGKEQRMMAKYVLLRQYILLVQGLCPIQIWADYQMITLEEEKQLIKCCLSRC